MKSKLYKHVEQLLLSDHIYRNSDKKLVWQIWHKQGLVKGGGFTQNYNDYILRIDFMKAKSAETILRTRRKVIENYKKKNLGHLVMPIRAIEKARRAKAEKYKGMHVYQERL